MLRAKRHPMVSYLIYVTSDELPAPANVVAKHNTKVGQTWRTNHAGPHPTLTAIREAVATA